MTTTTGATPSLDLATYMQNLTSGTASSSASSPTSSSTSSSGGSTLDKNAFMQLMVTQLKYQDPLNPSDNQQMAAQMAQFSSLESLQNMQTSLTALGKTMTDASATQTAATNAMATTSATALLGDTVRLRRASIDFSGASEPVMVHGAAGSELAVLDSKGNTVRSIPLGGTDSTGGKILDATGNGTVTWDGRGDDGKIADSGKYTLSVRDTATGADAGYAYEEAAVTGVGTDSTGTVLETATATYHLSDLVNVASSGLSGNGATGSGSSTTDTAISLIGRTVRVRDGSAILSDTPKGADWNFAAQAGSKGEVMDSTGKVVRTFSVSGQNPDGTDILAADGTGKYHWDGQTDDGAVEPGGTYYLQVVSADGASLAGTPFREVKIDQVGFDSTGTPLLMSGNKAWSYKNLYTVS